jgi:hypothetical protein
VIRTQVQLTEAQARRLRAQARERGISVAEIVRQLIDKGLAHEAPSRAARYERAARVVGRFGARRAPRDLSSRHDRYLEDSYE